MTPWPESRGWLAGRARVPPSGLTGGRLECLSGRQLPDFERGVLLLSRVLVLRCPRIVRYFCKWQNPRLTRFCSRYVALQLLIFRAAAGLRPAPKEAPGRSPAGPCV